MIQTLNGEDGFCEEKLEFNSLLTLSLSRAKFVNRYQLNIISKKQNPYSLKKRKDKTVFFTQELNDEFEQLEKDRETLRMRTIFPTGAVENAMFPCNVKSLICSVKKKFGFVAVAVKKCQLI